MSAASRYEPPWPRYHRVAGELIDIDAPITSMGFSPPEEGGAA
jgi:hypothetical protein